MDSVREGKWIASDRVVQTGTTSAIDRSDRDSAASDRVLRPEPATTGRTADERLTGLRFESVVADDEGRVTVRGRIRSGIGVEADSLSAVRTAMVSTSTGSQRGGFEGRLAVGHLGPAGDDNRGVRLGVAHHDDEPDPAVDEGEAPAVCPVPAELSVTDRVAD